MNVPNPEPLDGPETPEQYLEAALQQSIVLNEVIEKYGAIAIRDYLKLLHPNLGGSYQGRDDVGRIIHNYTQRLLGESTARRASDDFIADPIVLTANHHGVDSFSHSFQAALMFALYRLFTADSLTTVPVFSCGNVPLNNATYPQGLFCYSVKPQHVNALPLKLPIFPDRLKRQLVSRVQPFDSEMVDRAKKRLDKMLREHTISSCSKEAAETILSQDYSHPSVMEQASYSDQAVVLNHLIWKRVLPADHRHADVIYLELEKIAAQILELDLQNETSLIYKIMFDPELRNAVLHELDGVRSCWNLNELKKRSLLRPVNHDEPNGAGKSGTLFFWGLDPAGRRIPLYLGPSGNSQDVFIGIDDHHERVQLPFGPEAILDGLTHGRLLPSIFTCYLVLSLARGIRLIGSYFQGEYLPRMQKGVVNALRRLSGYREVARQVEAIETNFYLSGMLPVMTLLENEFIIPAGPIEVVAGGGLTPADIEKILSVKVGDAHTASLLETLPDFIAGLQKGSDWKGQIAKTSRGPLNGKVVTK